MREAIERRSAVRKAHFCCVGDLEAKQAALAKVPDFLAGALHFFWRLKAGGAAHTAGVSDSPTSARSRMCSGGLLSHQTRCILGALVDRKYAHLLSSSSPPYCPPPSLSLSLSLSLLLFRLGSQLKAQVGTPAADAKTPAAEEAVMAAEQAAEQSKGELATVTARLLGEVARFKQSKADDMRKVCSEAGEGS